MKQLDLSEFNLLYQNYRESLDMLNKLIDSMECDMEKIDSNDWLKKKISQQITIMEHNYNLQIELINAIYNHIHVDTVPKSVYDGVKEKLEKCRLYITALGGDYSNVGWMKKEDFRWR